jgi:hypothetical protein
MSQPVSCSLSTYTHLPCLAPQAQILPEGLVALQRLRHYPLQRIEPLRQRVRRRLLGSLWV